MCLSCDLRRDLDFNLFLNVNLLFKEKLGSLGLTEKKDLRPTICHTSASANTNSPVREIA